MLIGEFQSKLTEGQRLAIPKKFRGELGDSLIITRGYEGNLVVVNKGQFEKLAEGLADKPFIQGDISETTRFLLSDAAEVDLDEQGRFVLPISLREEASIKNDVVFLGLLRWVEIWSQEKWLTHKSALKEKTVEITKRLAHLEK